MKLGRLSLAALWVLGFGIAVGVWMNKSRCVSAQGCLPASYTTEVFPWARNTSVNFMFDVGLIGDPSNPLPKFLLNSAEQTSIANGITAWNSHSTATNTGVTFHAGSDSLAPFTWLDRHGRGNENFVLVALL